MKAAFFEIKDWEKKVLKKKLKDMKLVFCDEKLSTTNVSEYKDVEVISVFIGSQLSADVLKELPLLEFISTRSTGYDHIDLKYCKKAGIQVSNVPAYGENTVAEHSFMLLLALTHRLKESLDRVEKGQFSPEGLTGIDLKGKILGVIGAGHIGCHMIKMALGFGMKVIAYDKFPNETLADELEFTYVELDYLMSKSDFISLHVPYLKETHHIIDRLAISKMKNSVIIINTARGALIETDALFDALKEGKVGGAGLDVLEEEGFLKEELELLHIDKHEGVDLKIALENHMMSYLPNVIITPHNAFNSHEALQRILDTTVDNMTYYTKGDCKNLVTTTTPGVTNTRG